jgi:adenosylmethionine-8-amino-7-oxononanoate aminotransferase
MLENNETALLDVSALDAKNVIHPWHSMGAEATEYMVASRAEGIFIYDDKGKRYIDGPGGMWSMQIGYGRKEMADAISRQVLDLPFSNPWSSASEPSAVLAAKLAAEAPGDLNNVFFTTGGSTAVDTAIRFVWFYNNIRGKQQKKGIVARQKGYHGSTYLASCVSGKERDKSFMDIGNKHVHFLNNINPSLRPDNMDVAAWCDKCISEFEELVLNIGSDKIAAFIAEPVLASGGVIVPPEGYHSRCLEICKKYDIIYISDEVVTAFGRLGEFFSSKSVFGIEPDIITMAKGITSGYVPLGGVLISDRLMDEIKAENNEGVMFSNGFTYSSHPVSCTAALKNIEIMEREGLFEHVKSIAPYFQSRLKNLRRYKIVGDTRGIGLLGCVEGVVSTEIDEEKQLLIDYEFGMRLDQKCESRGLIVRPLINMCVFSPPLIIQRDQIDLMFDIIEEALEEVAAEML